MRILFPVNVVIIKPYCGFALINCRNLVRLSIRFQCGIVALTVFNDAAVIACASSYSAPQQIHVSGL